MKSTSSAVHVLMVQSLVLCAIIYCRNNIVIIFAVFILGWHATEDSEMSLHVFAGQAKATLVRNMFLESIAKTFTEHPTAPMPKKRSHLNLTSSMVLQKSNPKKSLSYHQGLACLNDVEASC